MTNLLNTDLFTSLFTIYLHEDGDDDIEDDDEGRSLKAPLPLHFRLCPHSAIDQPGQRQQLPDDDSFLYPPSCLLNPSSSGTDLSGGR